MTSTIQKKKEYLNQVAKQRRKVERMLERAEEYKQLSYSIPGVDFEHERVDHTPSLEAPFVKWLLKLSDLEKEIEKEKKKLDEILVEVTAVIEAVDDENQKSVLLYRYIDNMIWEDIMDKMCVSEATIHRWHSQALQAIVIPSKNESQ